MPFLLPGSCERPADILIPNYSAGKDLAVDFAVTCPLLSAYLHEAANTSLYACNKYAEDIKLTKFQNRVQLEGLDYLPFVFESFGGLSMDTESFISKLATSISHRFGFQTCCSNKHFPKCCLHFKQKYSLFNLM